MHNPGPLELEHACWDAIIAGTAVEFLDHLMTDQAILLPADKALRRKEILEFYADPSPWRACQLEGVRVVEVTEATVVLTYTALLVRPGATAPESLSCASVYLLADGVWRRSFHEQGAL